MTEYTVEWLLNSDADGDEVDGERLVESLAAEIDGEVRTSGPVRRYTLGESPYDSTATLEVSGVPLLLEVVRLLKARDDSAVGIVNSDEGKYGFSGKYETALVREVGGTVVGTVEGDVLLAEFTSDQLAEFNARRDDDGDADFGLERAVEYFAQDEFLDDL